MGSGSHQPCMQNREYPGLLTPTCPAFCFSSLLNLCLLAGPSPIPPPSGKSTLILFWGTSTFPFHVPWVDPTPEVEGWTQGHMIQCWPDRTLHLPGCCYTDWFRMVQMAQDWPLRVRPRAVAKSLGKEALSFEMRDYLFATTWGEAIRKKANPEGTRAQRWRRNF